VRGTNWAEVGHGRSAHVLASRIALLGARAVQRATTASTCRLARRTARSGSGGRSNGGGTGTRGLVDLERVDRPVRLVESTWVILDEGLAGGAAAHGREHASGPVSAESVVEDDLVVGKEGAGTAVSEREVGSRGSPA